MLADDFRSVAARRLLICGWLLALAVPSAVNAYEGELHLDVQTSIDGATLLNPRAGGLIPVGQSSSIGIRPRGLVGLRYSLTHSFYFGASIEGMYNLTPSLSPFWTISRTTYDNQPSRTPSSPWSVTLGEKDPALAGQFTGDLYAMHGVGALLLSTGFRPNLGYNYMGIFEVAAGPAIGGWYSTGLTTPAETSPNGPAVILGSEQLLHQVVPGLAVRLQVGFEARLFDDFEIAALPYVEGSFIGTFAASAGVAIRGSYVLPALPL